MALVLVYLLLLIGFSLEIYQQEVNPSQQEETYVDNQDSAKLNIANVLVDQLKENKQGYSNNVWTTLGTIIGAIGMVLGSTKFQRILKSDRSSVPVIQAILLLLFCLHAYAYMLYQGGNIRLMNQLEYIVGSIEFYKSYRIPSVEVIFNLVFDTVLFVLLAYIIGRIRDLKVEDT